MTGTEFFKLDLHARNLTNCLGACVPIERSLYAGEQTETFRVERRPMTGEKSRQLKVGDRVRWQNDEADQGTVTETN